MKGLILLNACLQKKAQSIQSGVADSQVDPKSMHDNFYCSELHFYFFNCLLKVSGSIENIKKYVNIKSYMIKS